MEMKNAVVSLTNVDDTTQPTVTKKNDATIAIPNLEPPEKEEQKTKDQKTTQFTGEVPASTTKQKTEVQPVASKQVSVLDNPQPLDKETFTNPPCPGSKQLPDTIDNISYLLAKYGITARYNVIKKKIEINIPGYSSTLDNQDNVILTQIISLARLNGLSTGQVPAYVEALADRNQYNPVALWITSKPWDGKDRLPEIYATITEQEDYPHYLKEILIRKWLLSAVAAVFKPSNFKTRGVLTLQGPQGVGKTSWVMSLVTDEPLCEMVVKTDHYFDGSKDSVIGAITHWLVEIGELDSSFRKDFSRLKGFLTRTTDKVRRPYGRAESEYPRKTVFCATVNKNDFLIDDTGNTRFWTIPVTEINYQHRIDMQQVFAQLAEDYHQDEQWWLDGREEGLLETYNSQHRSTSVIRERLMETVDMELKVKDGNPAMSAIEVLRKLGYANPTNPQCRECGGILRELFGDPKKIRGIMKWRVPLSPSMKNNAYISNPAARYFGDELVG